MKKGKTKSTKAYTVIGVSVFITILFVVILLLSDKIVFGISRI